MPAFWMSFVSTGISHSQMRSDLSSAIRVLFPIQLPGLTRSIPRANQRLWGPNETRTHIELVFTPLLSYQCPSDNFFQYAVSRARLFADPREIRTSKLTSVSHIFNWKRQRGVYKNSANKGKLVCNSPAVVQNLLFLSKNVIELTPPKWRSYSWKDSLFKKMILAINKNDYLVK